MKLTTFNQDDDDFEEEKLKIFEKEEVKVMSLTKGEQLENVFKHTTTMIIDTVKKDPNYFDDKDKFNEYVKNISKSLISSVLSLNPIL